MENREIHLKNQNQEERDKILNFLIDNSISLTNTEGDNYETTIKITDFTKIKRIEYNSSETDEQIDVSLGSQDEQIVCQVDNQLDQLLDCMSDVPQEATDLENLDDVMNKMTQLHQEEDVVEKQLELPKKAYLTSQGEESEVSQKQEFLERLQVELERRTIEKESDLSRNEAFEIYLNVKKELNLPPTILQTEEEPSTINLEEESYPQSFKVEDIPIPEKLEIPHLSLEPPPPPQTLAPSERVESPRPSRKRKISPKRLKHPKAKYIYMDEQEELYLTQKYRGELGLKSMVVYNEKQKLSKKKHSKGKRQNTVLQHPNIINMSKKSPKKNHKHYVQQQPKQISPIFPANFSSKVETFRTDNQQSEKQSPKKSLLIARHNIDKQLIQEYLSETSGAGKQIKMEDQSHLYFIKKKAKVNEEQGKHRAFSKGFDEVFEGFRVRTPRIEVEEPEKEDTPEPPQEESEEEIEKEEVKDEVRKLDNSPYKYPYYTKTVQDSFNRVIDKVMADMNELTINNRLLSPEKKQSIHVQEEIIPLSHHSSNEFEIQQQEIELNDKELTMEDEFYDNYFNKVIEVVIQPIKEEMAVESKKEREAESSQQIQEINNELKVELNELKSVDTKLTKEINVQNRRGTAPPEYLNKIKEMLQKEDSVKNYLQQELFQTVIDQERGTELKREITLLKEKKEVYLKRLQDFSFEQSQLESERSQQVSERRRGKKRQKKRKPSKKKKRQSVLLGEQEITGLQSELRDLEREHRDEQEDFRSYLEANYNLLLQANEDLLQEIENQQAPDYDYKAPKSLLTKVKSYIDSEFIEMNQIQKRIKQLLEDKSLKLGRPEEKMQKKITILTLKKKVYLEKLKNFQIDKVQSEQLSKIAEDTKGELNTIIEEENSKIIKKKSKKHWGLIRNAFLQKELTFAKMLKDDLDMLQQQQDKYLTQMEQDDNQDYYDEKKQTDLRHTLKTEWLELQQASNTLDNIIETQEKDERKQYWSKQLLQKVTDYRKSESEKEAQMKKIVKEVIERKNIGKQEENIVKRLSVMKLKNVIYIDKLQSFAEDYVQKLQREACQSMQLKAKLAKQAQKERERARKEEEDKRRIKDLLEKSSEAEQELVEMKNLKDQLLNIAGKDKDARKLARKQRLQQLRDQVQFRKQKMINFVYDFLDEDQCAKVIFGDNFKYVEPERNVFLEATFSNNKQPNEIGVQTLPKVEEKPRKQRIDIKHEYYGSLGEINSVLSNFKKSRSEKKGDTEEIQKEVSDFQINKEQLTCQQQRLSVIIAKTQQAKEISENQKRELEEQIRQEQQETPPKEEVVEEFTEEQVAQNEFVEKDLEEDLEIINDRIHQDKVMRYMQNEMNSQELLEYQKNNDLKGFPPPMESTQVLLTKKSKKKRRRSSSKKQRSSKKSSIKKLSSYEKQFKDRKDFITQQNDPTGTQTTYYNDSLSRPFHLQQPQVSQKEIVESDVLQQRLSYGNYHQETGQIDFVGPGSESTNSQNPTEQQKARELRRKARKNEKFVIRDPSPKKIPVEEIQQKRISMQQQFERLCEESFQHENVDISDKYKIKGHYQKMLKLLFAKQSSKTSADMIEYQTFIRKQAADSFLQLLRRQTFDSKPNVRQLISPNRKLSMSKKLEKLDRSSPKKGRSGSKKHRSQKLYNIAKSKHQNYSGKKDTTK